MQQTGSRWLPPSDVRSHANGPIPPGSLFFAPPPAEIGKVLSAQSGLRSDGAAVTQTIPRKVVVLFVLFGLLVGGFLGAGFTHGHWAGILIGSLTGAVAIGWPIYRREGRRNDCTYVGTHGIARFPATAHGNTGPRGEVFLFADAVDLQTAFLGRNMGTNFNYQWKDARGKTLYKLEGGYYGGKNNSDPDAAYHFARAAEEAWCRYYLPTLQNQLRRDGYCRFLTRRGLSADQHAIVGPGYLTFVTGTKTFRYSVGEIDDILLQQGILTIRRKGAKAHAMNTLDGSQGIITLSYGSVANVRLFLRLITDVVGASWRDAG